MQNRARVFQNEGFTKIGKIRFGVQLVCKCSSFRDGWGVFFLLGVGFLRKMLHIESNNYFITFGVDFGMAFAGRGKRRRENPWSNSLPDPPLRQFGSTDGMRNGADETSGRSIWERRGFSHAVYPAKAGYTADICIYAHS